MTGPRSVAESVLFLFAHQDDEAGISTRIAHERKCGNDVWCAYLTDGASRVAADRRDQESSRVLRSLGVLSDHVVFLTDAAGRIADGRLATQIARARAMISAWVARAGLRFARIYTLDWEGGHHDHDAAYLLALALVRDCGSGTVYGYPFYNGFRRPRRFFRVASFVPPLSGVERRRVSPAEALRAASIALRYPSQRRTWIGLAPGFIVRMLVRREEAVRAADVRRIARPPHDGELLYESLFGVAGSDFFDATAALRAELQQPPGAPARSDA